MIASRIRAAGGLVLLAAALAGCGDRPPQPPDIAEVFPHLPLPPDARVVSRSGGADAMQIVLSTTHPKNAVESYYVSVLSGEGWRLVNQFRRADGELVLYAEQDGPPLWVRIRTADDSVSTIVELAGARVKPAS